MDKKGGDGQMFHTSHTGEETGKRKFSSPLRQSPPLAPLHTDVPVSSPLPLRPLGSHNVWRAAGSHGNVIKRITAWQKRRGFPLPTGGGEEAALITAMRGDAGSPRIEHLVVFLFYSDSKRGFMMDTLTWTRGKQRTATKM